MEVVNRIAPIPTGKLHVGTARRALVNYLYAKKHGGKFIVRVEDTDKERSTKEYEENILEGLSWLGLDHDEFYRQSERTEIYKEYLLKLIEEDKAYISEEESKANPGETAQVVRLRNPGKSITFVDEVRGEITFDMTELGDFVIARSVDDPLYHLAVVVDDADMGITHVIRGEDHISNTPRQILIQEALGFDRPIYAHMPLILAPDRSKLSKRKGETSVAKYAEEYLPLSLVNYLALLGWNPGTEQEFFSLEELIETFSLEQIQKGGAIFDIEKLKSINHHYLRELPQEKYLELITPLLDNSTDKEKTIMAGEVLRERYRTIVEIRDAIENGSVSFYFTAPEFPIENIVWKEDGLEKAKEHLAKVKELLEPVDDFSQESIKAAIWDYADEMGRGSVLWPLRYSLTGLDKSPDPFSVAEALGKEETIKRIEKVLT